MQQAENTHIRRALRAYHCHSCSQGFKEMVNLNEPGSVSCPNCHSEFIEEKNFYDQAQRAQQRERPHTAENIRP